MLVFFKLQQDRKVTCINSTGETLMAVKPPLFYWPLSLLCWARWGGAGAHISGRAHASGAKSRSATRLKRRAINQQRPFIQWAANKERKRGCARACLCNRSAALPTNRAATFNEVLLCSSLFTLIEIWKKAGPALWLVTARCCRRLCLHTTERCPCCSTAALQRGVAFQMEPEFEALASDCEPPARDQRFVHHRVKATQSVLSSSSSRPHWHGLNVFRTPNSRQERKEENYGKEKKGN